MTESATHNAPQVSAEHDLRVDYIELPAPDIGALKRFYAQAFGWKITEYGPDYASFEDGRLSGGFNPERAVPAVGAGALTTLFAVDIDDAERRVRSAGGTITTPTVPFPRGRRVRLCRCAGQPPLTIAVTGATGMIGGAFTALLTAGGHTVRRVTRTPRAPGDVGWHPREGVLDAKALDGVDAVVHLAGESVA